MKGCPPLRARRRVIVGIAATLALAVVSIGSGAKPLAGVALPISQARASDPLVVGGSRVASLLGVRVGDIVGFRWSNGWVQIPVQVDQRKLVELNTVYGKPCSW